MVGSASSNIECLSYLYSKKFQIITSHSTSAIKNGNIKCLKFIYRVLQKHKQKHFEYQAIITAIDSRNYKAFIFLLKKSCTWYPEVTSRAVAFRDGILYLHEVAKYKCLKWPPKQHWSLQK